MPISDDITIRLNIDFGGAVKDIGLLTDSVNGLADALGGARSQAGDLLSTLQSVASVLQGLQGVGNNLVPMSAVQNAQSVAQALNNINTQQTTIAGGGGGYGGSSYSGGGGYGGGGGGAASDSAIGGVGNDIISKLIPSAVLASLVGMGNKAQTWQRGYGESQQLAGGFWNTTPKEGGTMLPEFYGTGNRMMGMQNILTGGAMYGYQPETSMQLLATLTQVAGRRMADISDVDKTAVPGGRITTLGPLEEVMSAARQMSLDPSLVANIVGTVYSVTGLSASDLIKKTEAITTQTGRVGQQGMVMQQLADLFTGSREKYGYLPQEYYDKVEASYTGVLKTGTPTEARNWAETVGKGPQGTLPDMVTMYDMIKNKGLDPMEAMAVMKSGRLPGTYKAEAFSRVLGLGEWGAGGIDTTGMSPEKQFMSLLLNMGAGAGGRNIESSLVSGGFVKLGLPSMTGRTVENPYLPGSQDHAFEKSWLDNAGAADNRMRNLALQNDITLSQTARPLSLVATSASIDVTSAVINAAQGNWGAAAKNLLHAGGIIAGTPVAGGLTVADFASMGKVFDMGKEGVSGIIKGALTGDPMAAMSNITKIATDAATIALMQMFKSANDGNLGAGVTINGNVYVDVQGPDE